MALPIIAVKTIAELAFAAVPLIERVIRGPKRGAEKKKAAREFILEELQIVANSSPESLPDFANFDWLAAIQDWSEISALVDNVIDSIVALSNGLAKYNKTSSGVVSNSPLQLA